MNVSPYMHDTMRICYIITRSDSIGGAQLHVLDLARYFQSLGHSTHVICGGTGPFTELLRNVGIDYTSIGSLVREIHPLKDLTATRELQRAVQSLSPDLIHAHSSKAGILGRLIGQRLQIPTVFTAHGWSFASGIPLVRRTLYRYAEWWAARFPGTIITVSDYDRNYAYSQRVVPKTKMVTVRYGVMDKPRLVRQNVACEKPPLLTMVARFEPQKDQLTLIDALGRLRDLPWNLQFVGGGPLQARAERRVNELGLESRVAFLGYRSDVPALLESSDLFLLITNWEGLPISILEAMRAGLPVIASNVDGVGELVADGVSGYLVPRKDPAKLAERLRNMLTNRELLRTFGSTGRKRYEENFQLSRMARETHRVYLQVTQAKGSNGAVA